MSSTVSTNPSDTLRLLPVAGSDLEELAVPGVGTAVLGRGEQCDVCIADPSVSRSHASLALRGARWFLTDLGSRHGTQLNGIQLEAERPHRVVSGDFVRIGPCTYRVECGDSPSQTFTTTTTDASTTPGTLVERVPQREFASVAHRRLELLTDGAAALQEAVTEEAPAESVIRLCLEGSGFARAAVLRHTGSTSQVEVVAARDQKGVATGGFSFSRSLLNEASAGHIARMSETVEPPRGQSIVSLGIRGVLCAPIMMDDAVIGYIYMDSREAEPQGLEDAGAFCHAVSRLAGIALSHLKRADLEKRQERLDLDLDAARQAQAFLMPSESGSVGHLKYALRNHPGRVVAGDLFDIFELDEDRVGVCFGDVSGQGMGAAILMTAILSHLRASMARHRDPAVAIGDVNRYIAQRSPDNMFASVWVGVFDRTTGKLDFVDAGHGHWFVRRPGGEPLKPDDPHGLLIGIEPEYPYVAQSLDAGPNDRVILYSDGIPEHRNSENEEFGADRLRAALMPAGDPDADVEAAMSSLNEFIGGSALADDTTVASIQIAP